MQTWTEVNSNNFQKKKRTTIPSYVSWFMTRFGQEHSKDKAPLVRFLQTYNAGQNQTAAPSGMPAMSPIGAQEQAE
jgi:hypothetical protein